MSSGIGIIRRHEKTVYVASNCEDVELFVNGKSLGHGKNSDRYLFTFENVAWETGEIKAVAYKNSQPLTAQSKHTVGAPRRCGSRR